MAVIEYDNQKELMLSGEDKLTNVPQEFIIVTNMTDDTVYVSKDPDIADRLDDNEVRWWSRVVLGAIQIHGD